MRALGLTLATWLAIVPALTAQPSGGVIPTPGAGGPANALAPVLNPNSRLDQLLMQWESRMKNVDAVWVKDMTRTDKDKDGTMKVLRGEARFLKPNYFAVQLVRIDNPKLYEMKISSGRFLYDFLPQQQVLRVYELPPQQINLANAGLLSFVGGMGAAQAKGRFAMTLTKDAAGAQQPYVYIDVLPTGEEDKREFSRAQLVLEATTLLPRRLWMVAANGNETTYDLTKFDAIAPLKPADFAAPAAPPAWKVERVPMERQPVLPASQPRVIRPAAPGK